MAMRMMPNRKSSPAAFDAVWCSRGQAILTVLPNAHSHGSDSLLAQTEALFLLITASS